jgi:pimeloyl-ACP methyl ester carboxylesterase
MAMNRRQALKSGAALAAGTLLLGRSAPAQVRRPIRDIVVVLPGIMGSVLRKDARDVWALSGAALLSGLKTLGGSIKDLELKGDSESAESLDDGIEAARILPDTHLIPGLWKIDGYSGLTEALAKEFVLLPGRNYFEFAYDWRRDNRAAARRLARLSKDWLASWRRNSGDPNAKLILVAHSMGGLISRYFLEVLEGWRDTRALITFGTPYRGSLNALNFLVNGMRKGLGTINVLDISSMLRSFTSVYQLLPIYPCYDPGTGKLLRLTESSGIPHLDPRRVSDAYEFHQQIQRASEANSKIPAYLASRYAIHPIIGTYQSTFQVGKLNGNEMQMINRHPKNPDLTGDGTVPQASAIPIEPEVLTGQHRSIYVSELHGSLQNSAPMLTHVKQVLAEPQLDFDDFRGPSTKPLSVHMEDSYAPQEHVRINVGSEETVSPLTVTLMDAVSGVRRARNVIQGNRAEPQTTIDFGQLSEGTYRVRAEGTDGGTATDVFIVV